MIETKKIRGFVDYSFLYDNQSIEFKQALADYQKLIKRNGTEEDLLKHVAICLARHGIEEMIEGVGYVQIRGMKEKDEKRIKLWSGIYIKEKAPTVYYYVI